MKAAHESFLGEMASDAPAFAEEAAAQIERALSSFAGAGPEVRAMQRTSNLAAYATLIDLMRDGRDAEPDALEPLVRLGVPPLTSGIGLDDVMHAYRIGSEVFWRNFRRVGASYPDLERDFLLDSAVVGQRLLNDLSTAVARRYLEIQHRTLAEKEDAERAVIERIIGTPPRFDEATHAARSIDLPLTGSWWVATALPRSGGEAADERRSSDAAVRQHLPPRQRALVSRFDGALVAVVSTNGTSVPEFVWPGFLVGVGRVYPGAQGIRASHNEAREALSIARRRSLDRVRFEDAWLDRFFLGTISVVELADAVLAPLRALPPHKRARLEATLEAYLDSGGNIVRAARALHLHPQSLRYRMTQIQAILGPGFASPEQRLALATALKASRLFTDES